MKARRAATTQLLPAGALGDEADEPAAKGPSRAANGLSVRDFVRKWQENAPVFRTRWMVYVGFGGCKRPGQFARLYASALSRT